MSKIKQSLINKETDSSQSEHLLPHKAQEELDDQRKRHNILILIVTSSLNMLGYGIYGIAYGQWIYVRFEMDALGSNFSHMHESAAKDPCFRGNDTGSAFKDQLNLAQANSAHFSVWTTLCALIPSFFVNLLLGAYADQIGRRLIFILPLAGMLIRVILVIAVAYWDLDINFILVAYTICGFCGDSIAFIMAVYVYTADNTSSGKNRSFMMVVATAMNAICYNLSQFGSGYFIESKGYVWPMVTGLGAMILSFILIVVFLRETLDKSKVKRVSVLEGVRCIFSFYWDKPVNPMYKRKDFILLGLTFFAYASSIASSIQTIFLMNEPFCWGSRQIGYVSSAFGLAHSVVSTIVMRVMQYAFSDEVLVIFSLLSSAALRFVFAFANADWEIYIAYATGALEVSVLAMIRAILSRMVPMEKRGSLLASIAVMETATLAASGAGLNELYSVTVKQWRGLTYFVIGCMVCVSAAFMIVYKIMISLRAPLSTRLTVDGPDDVHPDLNSGGEISTIPEDIVNPQNSEQPA